MERHSLDPNAVPCALNCRVDPRWSQVRSRCRDPQKTTWHACNDLHVVGAASKYIAVGIDGGKRKKKVTMSSCSGVAGSLDAHPSCRGTVLSSLATPPRNGHRNRLECPDQGTS